MQELSGYTNPKMEFIWKVIGPAVNLLEKYHITGMLVPLLLLGILLYFNIFHKRSPKKKLTFLEKYWIAIWIGGLILTIFFQILLIINPEH